MLLLGPCMCACPKSYGQVGQQCCKWTGYLR